MRAARAKIIAEINRTAAANGGIPLGATRMEHEGIAKADWYGIYWARWGDAVKEAGFEPNQLIVAHHESHLLLKFAELALELKKIPAKGDLKLKRRSDRSFPSHGSFERLGSKSDLIAK